MSQTVKIEWASSSPNLKVSFTGEFSDKVTDEEVIAKVVAHLCLNWNRKNATIAMDQSRSDETQYAIGIVRTSDKKALGYTDGPTTSLESIQAVVPDCSKVMPGCVVALCKLHQGRVEMIAVFDTMKEQWDFLVEEARFFVV